MTTLGLTGASLPAPQPAVSALAAPGLRIEDALASPARLWIRGRVHFPDDVLARLNPDTPWWRRWRSQPDLSLPPVSLHLETRIGGQVFTAKVPLQADGRFQATFTTQMPAARRGWRMTRNRVTFDGFTAEKCGVALMPAAHARAAVLVVLPLAFTYETNGAPCLTQSKLGDQLTAVLRRMQQRPAGPQAFYYLACVPPQDGNRQAELALAATTLGWPTGHVVLLPTETGTAAAALAEGIDRLRWLFADTLEVIVLNREPSLDIALAAQMETKEDRANVRAFAQASEDPWKLVSDSAPELPRASVQSIRPTRAGLIPRHPIVFCHGMLATSTIYMQLPEDLNSFAPLRKFLHGHGFRILYPEVPATSGVVARAHQLREQILRWTHEPVNLIAHSMGGLDARYLITHLDMAAQVRSLTTIATPHRGTYLADWFLEHYRQRVPLLLALEALGTNVDGFRDCGLAACREFNERTPDAPSVRYFSYGGEVSCARVTPMLRRGWNLLAAVEGPNDGLVSVASARWGEYLGTIHADHFAQTPDATFLRPGEDFDALAFYTRLIEDLARRGF